MRLLLDTHVVVWWLADDPSLGDAGVDAITSVDNDVLVSAASIWEIEIKRAKRALVAPDDLLEQVAVSRFDVLAISGDHARAAGRLPPHHHDPFDRMLVAQAQCEGATLMTSDETIARYSVPVVAVG